MTKFLKISLIIFLSMLTVFGALFFTYLIITKDAHLDVNKLVNPDQNIIIYDDEGNKIIDASVQNKHKSVKIEELSDHTINAFIASEDRNFYSHNGLNYKRMFKALYKNIISGSFKEGASTISQQLIKNTHLSNDKTITRKLKEIKLTKKLEKRYAKDEILEMYLNTIYFGHHCYGLQSASEFYFDKKAEELSLNESATLVGLLTSPNNFSPFKNPEKSLKRRNTVLNAMHECGYIDEKTLETSKNKPLEAVPNGSGDKNSDYLSAVFDEIEETNIDFYALTDGCKIMTYLDTDLQNYIESMNFNCDNAVIVTTAAGGVSAYKSTIQGARRQPGSTIKPLAVYAPAIEEKLINTYTWILDEKTDFGGYKPENHDKKEHGYVTVTESLKNSYNIPAVKTLNTLTIPKSEKYLTKMDIKLDDDEKNLSLALGGMKYGLSLKELSDRYGIFRNGGNYSPTRFIKEIVSKDGKTLYRRENVYGRVFSEGTASLINGMLIETAKTGTAKKLSGLGYDVAAKTGTCGNSSGNTDAYTMCYTSEHNIGVWLGDKNNKRLKITGGGDGCEAAKNILKKLYDGRKPANRDIVSGTSSIEIDAEDYYSNRKAVIADNLSPTLNKLQCRTLKGNEPKEISTKFSSPSICDPKIYIKNEAVNIELCQTKYYSYIVKRASKSQDSVIYDGKWKKIISDIPPEGEYIYSVTPYFLNGENKIYGKEIILPAISLTKNGNSPQIKIPDLVNKDWYNL